jgi:hypothetical protein
LGGWYISEKFKSPIKVRIFFGPECLLSSLRLKWIPATGWRAGRGREEQAEEEAEEEGGGRGKDHEGGSMPFLNFHSVP